MKGNCMLKLNVKSSFEKIALFSTIAGEASAGHGPVVYILIVLIKAK